MLLETMLVLGGVGVVGKQAHKVIAVKRRPALLDLLLEAKQPDSDQAKVAPCSEEKVKQALDSNLTVASLSLGLASVGSLMYAPLIVASFPGFFYIGKQVFDNSYRTWRDQHTIGMDTLALLVKSILFLNGSFVLANLSTTSYALNRKLLHLVKDNSSKNVIDVFCQHPAHVFIVQGEVEVKVPFNSVQAGDIVAIHAGETIPVDGIIVEGHAALDQHLLTGEAKPAECGAGDPVFALTIVLAGQIRVRVEKTGKETSAAQIGQILNNTVEFKGNRQVRAEEISNRTVIPTLALAAISLPFIGISSAAACLNAHPRYKTTITGSVSMLTTLDLASRMGILIKDGRTLDTLNQIDTIVFDKTGTLTLAQPHVGSIHTYHGFSSNEVLHYAASAEHKQSHPVARAILEAARMLDLQPAPVEHANYKLGQGIRIKVDDRWVHVGSLRFMQGAGLELPPTLPSLQMTCHAQGQSLVLVALEQRVIGAIELHATIRPEVRNIAHELRQRGITSIYVLSGDHTAPTAQLAADLDIDHYYAEILPEQKANIIAELQANGKSVCYVGDGINDSIALKQADVSVSLHGASSIATDTAQVVLMDESLNNFCALFDLAKEYDTQVKRAFTVLATPHLLALSGSLFLHFSFLSSFILSNVGLFGGLGYALLPLWRQGRRQALDVDPVGQVVATQIDNSDVTESCGKRPPDSSRSDLIVVDEIQYDLCQDAQALEQLTKITPKNTQLNECSAGNSSTMKND